MERSPVELKVGGHAYRVVTSAQDADLRRYAEIVERKLRELNGPGPIGPDTMLLVAIALAHEVEAERERAERIQDRSRSMLRALLHRVDETLSTLPPTLGGATPEPRPPLS